MTRAWLLNCGFALGLLPGVALAQADSDTSRSPTTGAPGEIVVTARLEKTARNHERIAPNLINIQSAESIAKYPDYNAAEALSRIPGVSLSIDTGEGRFVNIRGIDGNLNGATFGGTPLLNTNAGGTSFTGAGRAVEFDTIPTGAIDQILVTKTLTPDHDAEGIGGSVDLSPRSAIGRQGFYVQGQLGEGYEPERKTTNLNEEFVVGDSFGHNANGGPLVHIVLTQNEHNDGRGFDDIEVGGYLDDPTVLVGAANQDKVVTDYQLRRYRYHRQRFGYSAGIEVTPDDDTRFFVRVNEAGYQEEVVKKRLQIEGLDGSGGTITVDPANPKGFAVTGADAVIRSTDEKETHRNFVTQIGGERRFGEIKVDWIGAYERATFFSPYNYGTKWDGPQGLNLTYDNVTDPNYPRINVAGVNLADPTLYNLVSVSNSQEYTADREWSYGLNVSAPLHLTHDDELKVGGLLRYRRKYDETSSSDGANAIPAGVLLSNYEGDAGAITNFYNGRYNIGYDVNTAGVERDFPTTPLTPLTKRSTGTLLFDDTENILAGYGQYSGNIEKLHFLIGVRVERTKTIYDSPTSLPPANQAIPGRYLTTTTDVNGNYLFESRNSYTNAFPSLQLRYEIQPNFIARAAYSTSISRPGFNLTTLNPNVVAPATAGGNGTISVGNPSLKPVYSHNFDLSVAYYLPDAGVIELGGYYKLLNNFIVARNSLPAPGPTFGIPDSDPSDFYVQTIYRNTKDTYARGIEASFVDKLHSGPAWARGLGVDLNFLYADSKVNLRDGSPPTQIPGTGPVTFNAATFYEAYGVRTRLALKYDSQTIFSIGGLSNTFTNGKTIPADAYLDKRITLDWSGGYDINRMFSFYALVKNITNAPLRYYEGTPNRPIQREYYGQTYEAGVKFRF